MPRGPQRNYGILIAIVIFLWRYPKLHVPIIILAVLVVSFLLVRGCMQTAPPSPGPPPIDQPEAPDTEREPPSSPADSSIHLTMGNPSGATDDPEKPNNFLMRKPYFALSYNNGKGTPNWVSWCLKEADLGHIPRDGRFQQGGKLTFRPDPDLAKLKIEWPQFNVVSPRDYDGSGFDRGHMCPFGDHTGTEEAAGSTFLMTNMIPQSPACNRQAWADFEDYCRGLVRKRHQTLYIVSGPYGQGGVGEKNGEKVPANTVGRKVQVTVPSECWKVVLALDNGKGETSDVNRVDRDSRVIAVKMPNDMTVGHGWAKYRTSVKEVEKMTGYNFFDRVSAAVIGPLKERVDQERIPTGRSRSPED